MNVVFGSATLAALCNSERRLADRWGPEVGRTVGRHLLDLAAADAADIDRLPGAHAETNGAGGIVIVIDDDIVLHAVIRRSGEGAIAERLVVTSLDVNGSAQR